MPVGAALERARPLWREAQGEVLDSLGVRGVEELLETARAVTALAPD